MQYLQYFIVGIWIHSFISRGIIKSGKSQWLRKWRPYWNLYEGRKDCSCRNHNKLDWKGTTFCFECLFWYHVLFHSLLLLYRSSSCCFFFYEKIDFEWVSFSEYVTAFKVGFLIMTWRILTALRTTSTSENWLLGGKLQDIIFKLSF